MQVSNRKIRISVTLLIASFMILIMGFDSPAHAVRKQSKGKFRVADEIYRPWSFQLALDEKIDTDDEENFSGIVFSVNHFYTKSSALRFSMGIGDRTPRFEERRILHSDGIVYTFDEYGSFDVTSVTFSLQGLFYSSPKKEPRFYWGLGPRLEISDANPLVTVDYLDDPYYYYGILDYNDGTLLALGAEGTMGFEVFFGRNVSMFAEYGITVQKEWYILEFDYVDQYGHWITETETFDNGFHVDASRIKLGLSMYF